MNNVRRQLLRLAGLAPVALWGNQSAAAVMNGRKTHVLDDFEGNEARERSGVSWNGFTDRVMGGRSDAEVGLDVVAGKTCARMTGTVTRRNNGGFIQLAMYFNGGRGSLDASDWKGLSLLVYGNDEDYNLHVQTADASWYDSSYRATFRAPSVWTRIELPWTAFEPSNMPAQMNTAEITRIGLLGWMREFRADVSLGEISLYA